MSYFDRAKFDIAQVPLGSRHLPRGIQGRVRHEALTLALPANIVTCES